MIIKLLERNFWPLRAPSSWTTTSQRDQHGDPLLLFLRNESPWGVQKKMNVMLIFSHNKYFISLRPTTNVGGEKALENYLWQWCSEYDEWWLAEEWWVFFSAFFLDYNVCQHQLWQGDHYLIFLLILLSESPGRWMWWLFSTIINILLAIVVGAKRFQRLIFIEVSFFFLFSSKTEGRPKS